jgi:regulator of protease activity HflC (stomatin/prohibitin superfamily)
VVRPAIRTALRDAASYFNAVDIYAGKREEFVQLCKSKMDDALSGKGVIVERVLLRNVALPDRVRQAIEEKLSAEQEAQRMEFVLQKERLEAERKRVEATGLADAQKIINATLTPQYLQYLYLTSLQKMAESQNTTFLIAPYDRNFLPLINVK